MSKKGIKKMKTRFIREVNLKSFETLVEYYLMTVMENQCMLAELIRNPQTKKKIVIKTWKPIKELSK